MQLYRVREWQDTKDVAVVGVSILPVLQWSHRTRGAAAYNLQSLQPNEFTML
jgi:hypothetical protein